MTVEEAVKYLKQLYPNGGHCWLDEQRIEAISMAIKALQKEHVSEGLEEAARNYGDELDNVLVVSIDDDNSIGEYAARAFKAGAQWQKLKIIYNAIIYNDKIYPTTYENEPTEFCLDGGEEVRLITEAVNSGLLKQGDKVKVIIIKNE